MTDDRTPYLDLPLPHPLNNLSEDITRLRASLNGLDAKLESLDVLLQSDDVTLDQLQELVNAIKDNRDTIDLILNDKADAIDLTVQEEVQTLAEGQTIVDLVELPSTAGCDVYVEGVRLNKTEWARSLSVPKRITLSASYPAGHTIAVVRLQGGV